MSRWRGLREDQRVGEGLVDVLMSTLQVPVNLCRRQRDGEGWRCGKPTGRLANKFAHAEASLRSTGTIAQTGGWVSSIDGRWLTS
jgi:hypothetical protein